MNFALIFAMSGKQKSLLEHLGMPEAAEITFEPSKINTLLQQVDFT